VLSSSDLYTALNVSAVTSLLDSYGTGKALWYETLIPQDFTKQKSINFYRAASADMGLPYTEIQYNVNCRAGTQGEAENIADKVIENINRVNYTGYYISCTVLPVIPPADDRDNYNCIVQAILKKR